MESIWEMHTDIEGRAALTEDIERDVAVIGGGMAGILTAFLLREKGVEAVVLEANRIGSGQTMGTTAKITSQHDVIYDKLIRSAGIEQAYQYAKANQQAIEIYARIIDENGISCDFTREPAYLYSTSDREVLEREAEAAESLGIPARITTQTSLPFPVVCAMMFPDQAHFQPLDFLKEIAKPLEIYEHTAVRAIEDDILKTDHATVKAKKIVMATHYPFINTPGYYFMRMHQERSYLLALENAKPLDGMYLGIDKGGYTFRNYRNYLLFGGGGHRTGENSKGGVYASLSEAAKGFYPECTETARWSAQDCFTLDSIPYIGKFSAETPHMYVATGFKKWGMTSSMVSAMILSAMICDEEPLYASVFTPQRFHFSSSAAKLFEEGAHAVKGLSKELFQFPKEQAERLPAGQGSIVEYDGKKAGVYKNEDGELFAVSTKCSHLGCQLDWNPDETSWECPCHGSRFDIRGNVINNPAMNPIERLSDTEEEMV